MMKSPSTAIPQTSRKTLSPQEKARIKTAAMSSKRFKIVYPSEIKKKNAADPVSDLRKALSINATLQKRPSNILSKEIDVNKIKSQSPPKRVTEFGKVDEYKEEEEKRQKLIERMKMAKKNYTRKLNHLTYKSLKYNVDEVFKPEKIEDDKDGMLKHITL